MVMPHERSIAIKCSGSLASFWELDLQKNELPHPTPIEAQRSDSIVPAARFWCRAAAARYGVMVDPYAFDEHWRPKG